MRGEDHQRFGVFSYVSLEERVPQEHPLRPIRKAVDEIFRAMNKEFDNLYAKSGRPSIPPERLLRALLLQIFYSVRSERLLMEQLEIALAGAESAHARDSIIGVVEHGLFIGIASEALIAGPDGVTALYKKPELFIFENKAPFSRTSWI